MIYVESRNESGSYERWNYGQYLKYMRAVGSLPVNNPSNHPTLGKSFIYHGKKVSIISVKKQWYCGYYFFGVFEDEFKSSGAIVVENINSIAGSIKENESRFFTEFKLVE